MKTLTSPHWALPLILLGLLGACGAEKKNTVNSNGLPSSEGVRGVSPGMGGPGYSSYYNPQVQQIKAQYPCAYGPRLQTDLNFNSGVYNNSNTTLAGPFNQGNTSGQVSGIYVGKSPFNDLMIISKVTNGSNQLLGWNITISMCSYGNGLVSDQRPLSGFLAPQGITIAESTSCGWGDILAAQNTIMIAGTVQMAGGYQLPPQQVVTTFTVAGCGSSYPSGNPFSNMMQNGGRYYYP